ncbi:MAG: response regulator [Rhodospirillaceae bacterium]|nr:response regulator [Rhodospirillaceae bacterium]
MHDAHIVIVDDDPRVLALLDRYLSTHGYKVTTVPSGQALWRVMEVTPVDVVVLDLLLPGEDGLELARKLRAGSDVGIIMLTSKGDTVDRIVGLEVGADDYVPKPFDTRELLARVRSVLRRRAAAVQVRASDEPTIARFAGWEVDLEAPTLRDAEGQEVPLTTAEHKLLVALVRRPKRVMSREQLLDIVAGRDHHPFDRSIDVLVVSLRQKIEANQKHPSIIKTIRGAGYMCAVDVELAVSNPVDLGIRAAQ